jgi:DNA-directed RNA polymerase III subunit RPC1
VQRQTVNLKWGNLQQQADSLRIGDQVRFCWSVRRQEALSCFLLSRTSCSKVDRHLRDGDVVLFNRQPSLHKISIMCHRVRVMKNRTFRLNEAVCTPYGADFDGDEMNVHVPQTEEARCEARLLMGVKYNMITPKTGDPLVAAIQDFITASYLLSHKDRFLDRSEFCQICCCLGDGLIDIDLPPPAIIKPQRMWTGKQVSACVARGFFWFFLCLTGAVTLKVFGVLLRPSSRVPNPVSINLEVKNKNYKSKDGDAEKLWMTPNDAYVIFSDSELMCGLLDKKILGSGSKQNLIHLLLREYGPTVVAHRLSNLAKMCARFLGNFGFSIGIEDVAPSDKLMVCCLFFWCCTMSLLTGSVHRRRKLSLSRTASISAISLSSSTSATRLTPSS